METASTGTKREFRSGEAVPCLSERCYRFGNMGTLQQQSICVDAAVSAKHAPYANGPFQSQTRCSSKSWQIPLARMQFCWAIFFTSKLSGRVISTSHCPQDICPNVRDRLLRGRLFRRRAGTVLLGQEKVLLVARGWFSQALLWAEPSCFGSHKKWSFQGLGGRCPALGMHTDWNFSPRWICFRLQSYQTG